MQLIPATKEAFPLIFREMEKNFIRAERRDYEQALAVFDHKSYTAYLLVHKEETVGFLTAWQFPHFTFLEHFVIFEPYRCHGLGALAIEQAKSLLAPLVLEVEPPESVMATRRLGFYKRLGFCENPFPYLQPSYHESESAIPLLLLSYPHVLADFQATVTQIYETVYGIAAP